MSTSSDDGVPDISQLSLDDTRISVFCYGSSPGNGKDGATMAYACVFPSDETWSEENAITDDDHATNQRAILHAAIAALGIVNRNDPKASRELEVFSNSTYLNDAMNGANGKRKNLDLLKQLEAAVKKRTISWKHYQEATHGSWAKKHHAEAEAAAKGAALPFEPKLKSETKP